MQRFAAWFRAVAVCRHQPIFSIRALSILSFTAVLAAFIAHGLGAVTFGDFLEGMALSFSAILVMQLFRLRAVEYKDDSAEGQLTELRLSR
jgi:hypothetical protein